VPAVEDPRAALHAPFLPVRARRVATVLAIAQAIVLTALAIVLPHRGPGAFQWYDRLGVILMAALVGWLLSRYARIRAVPDENGLAVRNLFQSRDLAWPEIIAVRFGGGAPWVVLDLADTETLSVLAIQRADGALAEEQARRLATLVALHSRTSRND
jgi:hypothetical protein